MIISAHYSIYDKRPQEVRDAEHKRLMEALEKAIAAKNSAKSNVEKPE